MSNQQESKQQAAQQPEAATEVQFKRLSVNKETITDLDVPDAERVRGGNLSPQGTTYGTSYCSATALVQRP